MVFRFFFFRFLGMVSVGRVDSFSEDIFISSDEIYVEVIVIYF